MAQGDRSSTEDTERTDAIRVAVVSNRNRPGFPEENILDHLAWIEKAADAGARLVLFPELSLSGYTTQPFVRKIGMTLKSPWCISLIRAAREQNLFVAFGLPLRYRRRLYISHALFGPRGVIGHYEVVANLDIKHLRRVRAGSNFSRRRSNVYVQALTCA